jgi:hypothetical protein
MLGFFQICRNCLFNSSASRGPIKSKLNPFIKNILKTLESLHEIEISYLKQYESVLIANILEILAIIVACDFFIIFALK